MTRVGVICSSGGSVFGAAVTILKSCGIEFEGAVVTDRPCGIESICADLGVPVLRVEEPDFKLFSSKAAEWLFDTKRVDWTLLFFTRLVDESIYKRAPCINFHPSLLPAFPGFNSLRQALRSSVKFFGATAHLADQSVDGGRILAQVVAPVPPHATLPQLERISFAQKLYLLLVIFELDRVGKLGVTDSCSDATVQVCNCYASPAMQDRQLESAYWEFVRNEGIVWPS